MEHSANQYGSDCGGMLIGLWVFLGLSGLAVICIIVTGYLFKKKVDAEIELSHRNSAYVPPA